MSNERPDIVNVTINIRTKYNSVLQGELDVDAAHDMFIKDLQYILVVNVRNLLTALEGQRDAMIEVVQEPCQSYVVYVTNYGITDLLDIV